MCTRGGWVGTCDTRSSWTRPPRGAGKKAPPFFELEEVGNKDTSHGAQGEPGRTPRDGGKPKRQQKERQTNNPKREERKKESEREKGELRNSNERQLTESPLLGVSSPAPLFLLTTHNLQRSHFFGLCLLRDVEF